MDKVLLFGDIDEAGGTGAYFMRVVEYLGENYHLHVALRKGQDTMALRGHLSGVRCSWSVYFRLIGRVEKYAGKMFSRLGMGLPYMYVRDVFLFARLLRKVRPDLVFISQGGGVNHFSVLLLPVPVVIVCHSMFNDPITKNMWGYSFLKLFAGIDPSMKSVVHVSEAACLTFKANIKCNVLAHASIVVHNYGFQYPVRVKNDGKIKVLTMGHVVEYKNPHVWIKVARRLNQKFPGRLAFDWAGIGPMLRECRIETIGDPNITFLGYQKDLAGIYAGCDIYFQPSLWENHSISVVEAMGAGIPCVVSSAGGSPESVRNGVDGFVCDPSSVDAYVDAIARLIKDPSLMQRMGESARERFASEFSREIWARKMKSVIASVTQE